MSENKIIVNKLKLNEKNVVFKENSKNVDDNISTNSLLNNSQAIMDIINNSGMEKLAKNIKSIIFPTDIYIQNLANSVSSLQSSMTKLLDIIKPLTEIIISYQIKATPYFKELGIALHEAQENPDSKFNWLNYCEKLEEYFWTYPFDMKSEELKNVLEKVNSEEEFDKYMQKYFNNAKIKKLKDSILSMLPHKHRVIFKQIMNAFYNKDFAICNIGITAMIDDLCTYFLKDKGCLKRNDLFLPIIEEIDYKTSDIFEVLPLYIVNSNINKIYENVDFTKRISIETHKKTRRNTNQHGKKFINKKLDSIMLLNTMYYLLLMTNIFSSYKDKIIYIQNKSQLPMAKVINRTSIPGFYLKKKYYRQKKKGKNNGKSGY